MVATSIVDSRAEMKNKIKSRRWWKSGRLRRKLKSRKMSIPNNPNRTSRRKNRLGKPWVTKERGRFTDYYSVEVKDKEIEHFIMGKPVRPLLYKPMKKLGISQSININTFD